MRMSRIFIQIAAYRDPQLLPTLRSLDAMAERPDLLRFGVCRQYHPRDEFNDLGAYCRDRRVSLIDIRSAESRGACWARHLTQRLFAGEDYTLQIDSHTRVAPRWDRLLIDMLRQLQERCGARRPLLTAYAPMFNPSTDDVKKRSDIPIQMIFSQFTDAGMLLNKSRAMPQWRTLRFPVRTRFFSGHFAFAEGYFIREVPYDPHLYFHGEEITMAVRAFTHGYDLFHPHRVLLWHCYERGYRVRHWDDHESWYRADQASHRRVRALLGMERLGDLSFGPYGLGMRRGLRDYEEFAGISFRRRTAML
jgi:hypothetical protein